MISHATLRREVLKPQTVFLLLWQASSRPKFSSSIHCSVCRYWNLSCSVFAKLLELRTSGWHRIVAVNIVFRVSHGDKNIFFCWSSLNRGYSHTVIFFSSGLTPNMAIFRGKQYTTLVRIFLINKSKATIALHIAAVQPSNMEGIQEHFVKGLFCKRESKLSMPVHQIVLMVI